MSDLSEDLEKAVLSENLFETNEVVEKIKKEQNPFEYVAPMFRLMEENPELDFGMPGPMVHFIESPYRKGKAFIPTGNEQHIKDIWCFAAYIRWLQRRFIKY